MGEMTDRPVLGRVVALPHSLSQKLSKSTTLTIHMCKIHHIDLLLGNELRIYMLILLLI